MTGQHELDTPPHDHAAYLILDEQWRILAADDGGALAGESESAALVGQEARLLLGADALTALRERGSALLTLDNVDYVLHAVTFALPAGIVRLIRVQEVQSTLEHVLSMVVHEIRNPLSAMRALVQGLDEALEGAGHALAYTQRITEEIDRLSALLASMATVARPQPRPPEVLRPQEVLERAADVFRHELARRGIGLQLHITPRAAPILADPDQLQQVLVNLIANAIDAMPHGGSLILRARLDPRGRPVLMVEDTGLGMSAEALERALRPRQSTKPGGMGLGLMIVRSIIQQHQGRLRITSTPQRGTLVTVIFPAVADEVLALRAAHAAEVTRGDGADGEE